MPIPLSNFQSDDGFSVKGLINLLISMALASLALGFAANWVAQFFYLIILFPLAMGFVLIVVGGLMVDLYKIRNRMICLLAGILGSLLTFSSMHYFEYLTFRSEMDKDASWPFVVTMSKLSLEELNEQLDEPMPRKELQEIRRVVKAYEGFPAYLNFAAEKGVEIGRMSSSFNLGFIGTWIYWLLEMGLISIFVGSILRDSADKPFCVDTQTWMSQVTDLITVKGSPSDIASILKQGNPDVIPSILDQPHDAQTTQINLYRSEDQDSPNDVLEVVELIFQKDKDPKSRTVARFLAPKPFVEAATQTLAETVEQRSPSQDEATEPTTS